MADFARTSFNSRSAGLLKVTYKMRSACSWINIGHNCIVNEQFMI